jgi:acetolactate synthase-1/2/3 large subunit
MDHRDTGALQDMSTLKLMRSCSKWSRKVTNAARIPEYVNMALRNAMDSAPGPVYLEVPTDILFDKLEEENICFPEKQRIQALPFGDPNLVETAAKWLADAQKPAVLVDDGAHLSMGEYASS